MRVRSLITCSLAVAAIAAARPSHAQEPPTAGVVLRDRDGQEVGRLVAEETPAGILLRGTIVGLSAGIRAMHVHAVGRCVPPFESAGGHFNPANRQHGFRNPRGHHAGDLPNLSIPVGAPASVEMFLPGVTLAGPNGLLDADGSSVVIHAGPDDHRTDPSGNSGDRIACGVVAR